MARGFSQQYGLDYDETFSPVAKITTVRVLIALAASKSWKLWQMDVKNAFLHGEVDRDIYMEQPKGFENKEKRLQVLKNFYIIYYSPIEKACPALVFAAQKLRHSFLAHQIKLISRADPIKFLMTRPMSSGRLTKWSLLFSYMNIIYIPQKAVKGQALADFLAAHPIPQVISDDLPDEGSPNALIMANVLRLCIKA